MRSLQRRFPLSFELLEDRCVLAVVSVNATLDLHAINPLIYGTAYASQSQLDSLNATANRWGGNATTRYNWQNNASNRAMDWYFESLPGNTNVASGDADAFINAARAAGSAAQMTIPTIGWVAKLGPNFSRLASYPRSVYPNQQDWDVWWPDAGNGKFPNGTNITGTDPNYANTPSNTAFQHGWIQHLISTYGTSANGGVKYYFMDNEPSLWHETHRDVMPTGATANFVTQQIINYGRMIKSLDPNAVVIGPEEWGWPGFFHSGNDQQWGPSNGWNWPNAPDRIARGGMDYLPWMLQQIRQADQAAGSRSLDVFTIHWYPQGGEFSNDVSNSMQTLRNQSTRALWDVNYVDQSWLGQTWEPDGGRPKLIPRIKNWVNTYYPGTQTGITEYNWGAEGHMNGATTQADILGIFGRENLDMANRWTTPATNSPSYLAMKLYRNYDGNDSTFGQTSTRATVENPDLLSSFAALRSDGAMTVMVVNKDLYSGTSPTTPVTLNLAGFAAGGPVKVWQLAATNPASNLTNASISNLADKTIVSNSASFTVPKQSVTLLVVQRVSTITVTSNAANVALGGNVTFTATVSSSQSSSIIPTGSVQFRDGANVLGTAVLNASGVATLSTSSLTTGAHNITAVYLGDTGTVSSTSSNYVQNIIARPTVGGFQVNDGNAQRSMVKQLVVTFSTLVNLGSTAFTVTPLAGGSTIPISWTTATINNVTVATITRTTGASFGDGRWTLTTFANQVTETTLNQTMASNRTDNFFRLFGDANGDATVNATDLILFRAALGSSVGNSSYRDYFDANGDGVINNFDFTVFRANLGRTV
jgi:hypothetical protein